ncbi:MAG: phosphatase PAP2 family protein [Planctomycetaceae bacterium]
MSYRIPSAPTSSFRLSSFQSALLAIATALVAAGAVALAIDLPVAEWFKTHRVPGEIGRLINLLEISGHSLGAAIGLVAVVTLDRGVGFPLPGRFGPSERAFARMVVATYLGGLTADVIKVAVERVRPRAADLAAVGTWLGTFGDESLAVANPHLNDLMSFPSGHSAVAAGLAAALTWRYPHGWPLFAFLAFATALQRVATSAHYPSDVACGAAVGLVAAACCLGGPRPAHGALAGPSTP